MLKDSFHCPYTALFTFLHSVVLTTSEAQYTRTATCTLLDYHYMIMQSAAASITIQQLQLGHITEDGQW